MADLIDRKDAIDALKEERCPCESDYDEGYLSMLDKAIWIIQEWLPSAQPETDGFCTDCKEYDSERHFCPRFDRVIKKTVEEMGIIHCKDCKHGELFSDQYLCRKTVFWREGDFYCGYAERRIDDER